MQYIFFTIFLLPGLIIGCPGTAGPGISPTPAPDGFIAEYTDSNGLILWEYVDYITVHGYSGSKTIIVIPDTFNGKNVTKIDDSAFEAKSTLTNMTLPTGLTSIGTSASVNCSGFNSLNLSSSLTSIGADAFSNCSNLILVQSLNVIPPTAANNIFFNTDISLQIQVP